MRKSKIDIYKEQIQTTPTSHKMLEIAKKAKRYHVVVFENEEFAKKLLQKKSIKITPEPLRAFLWCLEQEKTVQMSS